MDLVTLAAVLTYKAIAFNTAPPTVPAPGSYYGGSQLTWNGSELAERAYDNVPCREADTVEGWVPAYDPTAGWSEQCIYINEASLVEYYQGDRD